MFFLRWEILGLALMVLRSLLRWLMSCMTLATSNTAVVTMLLLPNSSTNSEFSLPITTKFLPQHGES